MQLPMESDDPDIDPSLLQYLAEQNFVISWGINVCIADQRRRLFRYSVFRDITWRCKLGHAIVRVGNIPVYKCPQEKSSEEWTIEVPQFAGRVTISGPVVYNEADQDLQVL